MTCLCIDDLQAASFRGAPFWVKNDSGTFGRRIALHEYPMRDDPYNEDMGEKAQRFTVTAYVFGDDWIGQKEATVAASRARGPANLQLPADGSRLVVCNTLKVTRDKDQCGYFELQWEFTSAKNQNAALGVGQYEGLIGALITRALPMLTSYYDRNVVTRSTLQYVSDRQEARIAQFADDAIAAVESTASTNIATSTNAVQAAIVVYQNAGIYAKPDSLETVTLASQSVCANIITQTATDRGITITGNAGGLTVTSGASVVVSAVGYIIDSIGRSMSPDDVATTMQAFSTWSNNEVNIKDLPVRTPLSTVASSPIAPSEAANAINGTIFGGTVRSLSLMKLAQAISVKKFRTRQEAIQARATIVELFNAQIELFDEDEIVDVLLTVRDYAVRAVTMKMATLVPVLEISAGKSLPSLYWANRLYEDLYRSEELSDRNTVAYPAYMPTHFEALAR